MSDIVIANINTKVTVDFSRVFRFVDKNRENRNFLGSTFKCEVRPSPGSATLTKSLTAGLGTTDIVNGGITINWNKGDIPVGTWYYDLLIVTAGKQSPLMEGVINIRAGVTV